MSEDECENDGDLEYASSECDEDTDSDSGTDACDVDHVDEEVEPDTEGLGDDVDAETEEGSVDYVRYGCRY